MVAGTKEQYGRAIPSAPEEAQGLKDCSAGGFSLLVSGFKRFPIQIFGVEFGVFGAMKAAPCKFF